MLSAKQIDEIEVKATPYLFKIDKKLFLQIKPDGSKFWKVRVQFQGKEKPISLGKYPKITIENAKKLRDEILEKVDSGIDPNPKKEKIITLNEAVFEYIKSRGMKESTYTVMVNMYQNHIKKSLGNKDIKELELQTVINHIKKIESKNVAFRMHKLINNSLKFAKIHGQIEVNVLSDTEGAFTKPRTEHNPCIIDDIDNKLKRLLAVGKLLNDIHGEKNNKINALALMVLAHVFQRPKEVVSMKWSEIDFEEKKWSHLSSKTNVQSIVPLSDTVISLLNVAKTFDSPIYVFPARNKDKVIDKTRHTNKLCLNFVMNKLGYKDKHTPHGFRALARTILDEEFKIDPKYIEVQLNHRVIGHLGKTYNRAKYLDERIEMMNIWSKYLNKAFKTAQNFKEKES